jgi:hypothetical protein
MFGETRAYDDNPDGSDVTACQHCALPYGDWCLAPGASAECIATAQAGLNGNVLSIAHERIDQSEVRIDLNLTGFVPCGAQPLTPAIDAHFSAFFKQICQSGSLGPMQFKVLGDHDGFPWHEMYINGVAVYLHDPCCTMDTPTALFGGSGEYHFDTDDPETECDDGQVLGNYQQVPGT